MMFFKELNRLLCNCWIIILMHPVIPVYHLAGRGKKGANMKNSLKDKVVLITGASKGIGY